MATDRRNQKTWEHYGENDPYFGVITSDDFRSQRLDAEARRRFLESGTRYVEGLVGTLRGQFGRSWSASRVLDFGCGVGRLTIPLSAICSEAVGVDISDGMLIEAARNAAEQNRTNVSWVKGDETLSRVTGTFDLVHSFLVFQHISTHTGLRLLRKLISLLREGGTGSIHFTYANATSTPRWRMLATHVYRRFGWAYGLRNLFRGADFSEPMMQMNLYDLNEIIRTLQECGCHRVSLRFTETGHFGFPVYGVVVMFQKHRLDVSEHGALSG